VLGSVAFTPVKTDMLGNVKKIRDRQLVAPGESQSLQELVLNELKTKKHTATEGLVWLVRYFPLPPFLPFLPLLTPQLTLYSGLDFTCIAMQQNLGNPTEELSQSFRNAYGATLKPHHSFVVKPVFSMAMSACPYRKDFYSKLGDDIDKVIAELKTWLASLAALITVLKEFLARKEAKW
jgi:hypothetical protein